MALTNVVGDPSTYDAVGFQCPVSIGSRIWDGLAYFVLQPNFTSAGQYTTKIVDQG